MVLIKQAHKMGTSKQTSTVKPFFRETMDPLMRYTQCDLAIL